jgi:NADH-ubiquinone oxidoreductase chain 5
LAIEGPTPVSALIHAATLVTAGVYLLLRSSYILEYSPTTLIFLIWIGAITAFFAASTGLIQNDLKRIIAYSTCSQIGYLFIACGLSQYNSALFHLVNHAFFKALLFLAAGAVLHATFDQQDIRRLGGLINFLPFIYTTIIIGSFSLIAIPILTGFYSKEIILSLAYRQYIFSSYIAYRFGTISAGITAFYSIRLISLTFLTYPNANKNVYNKVHDASIIIRIVLFILSLLAIFFGYIRSDIFIGIGSDIFRNSLFILPNNIYIIDAENISINNKIIPLFISIIMAILSIYIYNYKPQILINITIISNVINIIYKFFNSKYYLDNIYNYIFYKILIFGYNLNKYLDRGIFEILGPNGISKIILISSNNISKLDTGNLTNYTIYIAISLVILTFILFTNIYLFIIDIRILFIILIRLILK